MSDITTWRQSSPHRNGPTLRFDFQPGTATGRERTMSSGTARAARSIAADRTRARHLAVAAIPAALYLAVRLVGALILWGMSAIKGRPFNVRPWDADWYLKIAEHGYAAAGEGMTDAHGVASPDGPLAFFPGYPLAVRLLAPIAGHSYVAAGLLVSTVAGIAGAYGIARLAGHLGGGRRAQLLAVVLTAGAPMSVVYTLGYPEALLIALCAWTLVAILERRWWLAAPLAAAAGLVNPMACVLIPVVVIAAGVDVYRERARWGAAVAAMTAPVGLIGYLLWVKTTSGVPGGYFEITRAGWGNHIDFGATTAKWILAALTGGRDMYVVGTAAAIIAAVAGVLATRRRMPWPVWLYTAGTVALIVGHSGLVQDRTRLLLSVGPLLIVAAVRLDRLRTRAVITVAAVATLGGLWFGAYALTVWPYAI